MNAPEDLPEVDEYSRLRKPPHSVEAEQSVLGGLLIDPRSWDVAGDILSEADFYRHEHRLIFAACAALLQDHKPADVVTVYQRLQELGEARGAVGLPYLNDLAQSVPSSAGIKRYGEIVAERALRREIIAAADNIATEAFNPQGTTASAIVERAGTDLRSLTERRKLGSHRVPLLNVGAANGMLYNELELLTAFDLSPEKRLWLVTGPNIPITNDTMAMQPAMKTNTPGAPNSRSRKAASSSEQPEETSSRTACP